MAENAVEEQTVEQAIDDEEQQIVVFELASVRYGIDIDSVQEVMRLQEITTIARAPFFVRGVINVRGKIIPVVDLRVRFGIRPQRETAATRIVVVKLGEQETGVVVDAVTEVMRIRTNAIEPPSTVITTADSTYLLGIAKFGERLVILLDLEKALDGVDESLIKRPPEGWDEPEGQEEALVEGVAVAAQQPAREATSEPEGAAEEETTTLPTADTDADAPARAQAEPAVEAAPKSESEPRAVEKGTLKAKQTLYEAIGGAPAVEAAVDNFYERVLNDPELVGFFDEKRLPWLKVQQRAFLTQVMSGPAEYKGRNMKEAHAHMTITNEHFDLVAGHLTDSLKELGVPTNLAKQVLGLVAPLRADIVTADSKAEAVHKAVGQADKVMKRALPG